MVLLSSYGGIDACRCIMGLSSFAGSSFRPDIVFVAEPAVMFL